MAVSAAGADAPATAKPPTKAVVELSPTLRGVLSPTLVPIGRRAARTEEISDLNRIVETAHATARPGPEPSPATLRAHAAELEDYLTKYTDSPYNASVRQDLAQWYKIGRAHV